MERVALNSPVASQWVGSPSTPELALQQVLPLRMRGVRGRVHRLC